jgi:hypothetical protein
VIEKVEVIRMPILKAFFSVTWRGQVAPCHAADRAFDCEAHGYIHSVDYVVENKGLSVL